MLESIIVVLFVLWALGMVTSYTMGGADSFIAGADSDRGITAYHARTAALAGRCWFGLTAAGVAPSAPQ